MKRPVVILLGPHRDAVSGVSTHLNLLLESRLAENFSLQHFQVGSEGRRESRLGRMARLLISPFRLALALVRSRAALLHVNSSLNPRAYWRDLAYLLMAKLCGVRVLLQIHGGALPDQFFAHNRLLTGFLRFTLGLSDTIVVLAKCELESYKRFLPRHDIVLIANAVRWSDFAQLVRPPRNMQRPLRLVYLGRLAHDKGLYEALRATRCVTTRGVSVQFFIAGSGPEESALRAYLDSLHLTNGGKIVGPVFSTAKIRLLGCADVLLLPSYAEGLPYALLEGMAAGAAVIATRVGAIPDVVVDQVHGFLTPCRDALAIGAAIEALANDPQMLERMGRASRQRVAADYSADRLIGEFSALYQRLCATEQCEALTLSSRAMKPLTRREI